MLPQESVDMLWTQCYGVMFNSITVPWVSQFIFGFYGRWCLQSSLDMLHIHALRVWQKWKRNIMRENCWRNKYLWSAVVVACKSNWDDMVVPHSCCFSLWITSPSYPSDVTTRWVSEQFRTVWCSRSCVKTDSLLKVCYISRAHFIFLLWNIIY